MIQPRARIKPRLPSLIGGIAVGIATFILWAAAAHALDQDTTAGLALGVLVAAGIGTWIRVADL